MPHHSKQLQLQRSFSGSLRQQHSFPEVTKVTNNKQRAIPASVSMPSDVQRPSNENNGNDNDNNNTTINWSNLLHPPGTNIAINTSTTSTGAITGTSTTNKGTSTMTTATATTTSAKTTACSSTTQELYHRVPQSPPENDANKNVGDGVLNLLAAAASEHQQHHLQEQDDLEDERSSSSSRPPKKRKVKAIDGSSSSTNNAMDSPSSSSSNNNNSIHVSPVSTKTDTTADSTVTGSCADKQTKINRRVLSYETIDSHYPKIPRPTSSQQPPHLPNTLHWLLTESSSHPQAASVRTVLHWVGHGQAFYIVRWQAFRRQLLPQFFPECRGRLDLFLDALQQWGFCEIQDGPDVGAFAHNLFRRGHPQLLQEMTIPESARSSREQHALLRVPSLDDNKPYWSSSSSSSPIVHYPTQPDDRPSYSPIRIRSGRGARRLHHTSPTTTAAPPPRSFPVSNRGGRGTTGLLLSKRTLPVTQTKEI